MAKKKQLFETASASHTAVRQIGMGGAGRVLEVEDQEGELFALKILNGGRLESKNIKRFRNELLFCFRQPHRNIIPVLDFGHSLDEAGRKLPFYVMPLCSESLRSAMRAGIPRQQILPIYTQLLDAVEAAHLLKVIHRDLKPENILFRSSDKVLQLADFGIARFLEEELYEAAESKSDERLANFSYASPEQKVRGARADERSDIFALGLILNELFTGEIPQGTAFEEIKHSAPEVGYLDRLVAEMIRQKPNERPQSIAEVKAHLIGHGNQFVTEQRVDSLRRQVVPATEPDDPHLDEPLTLVGIDYKAGNLFLKLSRLVDREWVAVFHSPFSHSSTMRQPPSSFQFGGDTATVAVDPDDVQRVVNYFKSWLPDVQYRYASKVRRAAAERDRQHQENLRRKTEVAEAELRVLRETKI